VQLETDIHEIVKQRAPGIRIRHLRQPLEEGAADLLDPLNVEGLRPAVVMV
jgi:hypothetical protein